mgnify:CR=1 FL=1
MGRLTQETASKQWLESTCSALWGRVLSYRLFAHIIHMDGLKTCENCSLVNFYTWCGMDSLGMESRWGGEIRPEALPTCQTLGQSVPADEAYLE